MLADFPFQTLLDWYKLNGRHTLPWRSYDFDIKSLTYRIWLSEVILQQTQAPRGTLYFKKILENFPTIESLANTNYETFFEYYDGLGYYSRARNMLRATKIVTELYDAVFPNDYELLLKIPWIWPYTAQAIQSFAYREQVLSFDTNLEKVFSRFYFWDKYQKLSKWEKEEIQKQFTKTDLSGREVNNALMDFSSLISTTKEKTDWENYPLKDCKWYQTRGEKEIIPEKKKKPSLKNFWVIIHLHENHKLYFSQNEELYQPFTIGDNQWADSRQRAKTYFKENFWLDVSVRPPHKHFKENGKDFIVCNAQIQKGTNPFFIYKKSEISQ